jgi:GNAT superfamily N-acetyltransferase
MNGREPFPELTLRVVDEGDVDAIVTAYRSLSPQNIYRRFFTLMPDPAPLVERHLSLVDHHDHEALVVLDGSLVVGVAHWDRANCCPDEAEVAITVTEPWQHRGLGRVLIRALAGDAHRHGIETLTATVLSDNRPALGLAAHNHPSGVTVDGPEAHLVFRTPPLVA